MTSNGGGLYIHQPNAAGVIDYAPPGFEFTVADIFWCDPPDQNTIVQPGHPTMAGLNDVDLPVRGDSVFDSALGAGYMITAVGVGSCSSHVHSAAGTYGDGRVFMDLANCSPNSIDPGADQYLINVIDWLCQEGPIASEAATWGRVRSLYR